MFPNLLALFMGIADQTIWAVAERPVNFHLAKRLNTTNWKQLHVVLVKELLQSKT